jgi:hypothetical protein
MTYRLTHDITNPTREIRHMRFGFCSAVVRLRDLQLTSILLVRLSAMVIVNPLITVQVFGSTESRINVILSETITVYTCTNAETVQPWWGDMHKVIITCECNSLCHSNTLIVYKSLPLCHRT